MVEDGSLERKTFDELLMDKKDRDSRFFIPLIFIGNTLSKEEQTLRLISGGVKVKMPSLGTETPLPMRRFLLT